MSQDVRLRFLQLTRARLQPSPHFQLDLDTDFLPDDEAAEIFASRQSAGLSATESATSTSLRSHCTSPVQICNIEGLLEAQGSLGPLHLGETFRGLISIANSASYAIKTLHCKVDLDTKRTKAVLYDTTSTAALNLAVGGRHDFVVRYDIKEVGAHVMGCQVAYIDESGDQQNMVMKHSFSTEHPLSVRTKWRPVPDRTLLEATIENNSKVPMIVDYIRLEAGEAFSSELVQLPEAKDSSNEGAALDLRDIQIINAGGGSVTAIFLMSNAKAEKTVRSEVLGKLDIKWRNSMGEIGRLQTQPISMTGFQQKDISLEVTAMDERIQADVPFKLSLKLASNVDRKMSNLSIRCKEDSATDMILLGPTVQSLPELAAKGQTQIHMQFLPRRPGAFKVPHIEVLEAKNAVPLDSLEVTVCVH